MFFITTRYNIYYGDMSNFRVCASSAVDINCRPFTSYYFQTCCAIDPFVLQRRISVSNFGEVTAFLA